MTYLRGRHAIVTGGGRGIGAAIAAELARLGARLTLMGRDARALESHASALRAGGAEASTEACDVADESSVARAFEAARARSGDAHVLVNNAGQADAAAFTQMSIEQWNRLLAVNLTGTMLCTRAALPAMLAARSGRVINVASTAGLRGYAKLAAYCASKHGVIGLTRALAVETARAGVTVNAICPGYTDTDMAQHAIDNVAASLGKTPEEALAILLRHTPRGTLVEPAEVASAVAWLCSPGASAVTGQSIAVAGGEVM